MPTVLVLGTTANDNGKSAGGNGNAGTGALIPMSMVAPGGDMPGYIPIETPYNNPGTELQLTPSIPTSPDCTVRPQTVLEIQRMRMTASRIAEAIQIEVGLMHKRKAYVEQMTAYINDRIRELNKVKSELIEELRWIEVSSQRIKELAEKEKLVKMQDILKCLKNDMNRLGGEKEMKNTALTDLQTKAKELEANVQNIQDKIKEVRKRQEGPLRSYKENVLAPTKTDN